MSSSPSSSSSASRMIDEMRVYRADDPNDAPERRLYPFVNGVGINPFIPTALPNYVIAPIADSLAAMQMWCLRYSAYQQQQQQQQQHHQLHQHHQPHLSAQNHQLQQQHHQQQQHQQQPRLSSSSPSSNQHHSHPSSITTASPATAASSPASSTYQHQHQHQQRPQSRPQSQPQVQNKQDSSNNNNSSSNGDQIKKQHSHIKKPLNPFMIYMQKRRPEIVRQGIIKESAAINQMLGQQWRQLTKEEQEPYYKLAEQEKILHAQKYPGWSARDNYANQKKKKKLKLKSISLNGLDQSDKKCRARFGLTNMASWCKPCKRKKKCIYSLPSPRAGNNNSDNHNHHHHHHHQNNLHNSDHHPHHNHNNLNHDSGHHLGGRLAHYPLQHSVTHMIN